MKILIIYPNEMLLNPPPVSMGLFTAILKKEGFELDLFDTTWYCTSEISSDEAKEENLQVRPFDFGERDLKIKDENPFEELDKKLAESKPDLVLISVLEPTYNQAISLLDVVAKHNIPVVAGGVFPTFSPEIMISHKNVKYICVGEGEDAILELCIAIRDNKPTDNIDNIWEKKDDGTIVKNKIRPVVDLNSLPTPDYSLFPPERLYRPMAGKVWRTVPIETNRGCPFQCAYCNSPSQLKMYRDNKAGMFFRKKNIDRVCNEITELVERWDAEYIYFLSDTFLLMTDKEFDKFIDFYSTLKLPFWMQTRPETVTLDSMKRLKEVGCHRMSMGVEHGNEEYRKRMLKKPTKNKEIIQATKWIAEAGIPLSVNNIIGFPEETRDLVFDTINLNRELVFDSTNAYVYTPFRGTPLYDYCEENNLFINKEDRNSLTKGNSQIKTYLPQEELNALRRTFSLYAKMPEEYWPTIKLAEKDDEKGKEAYKVLREKYIELFWKD
jgi:radical SAM superfamily enzyme YgiQ (UPF0313 family)